MGLDSSPLRTTLDGREQSPRVQRESAVPQEWVAEFDQTEEARRVRRLAEDVDLITSLALGRFSGPDYDLFALELSKYGLAVLRSWLRSGVIFQRMREKGLGGVPSPPAGALDDHDTVDELAMETVAKALWHFRHDVLMKGKWDPRRGATLTTFFIGQCLLRFGNIYRAWRTREIPRKEQELNNAVIERLVDRSDDGPAMRAIRVVEIRRAMKMIRDPRVRAALVLSAQDFEQWEIGLRLGVTEKSVERMLANHRARMRKQGTA